jgi:hypothetical protein
MSDGKTPQSALCGLEGESRGFRIQRAKSIKRTKGVKSARP